LLAKDAFGGEPIWVLWVDFDYRVAVLGTPSGRWGMILSRQTPPRPDLIKAARDVMDFNGYDMTQVSK
ncbi:lipocalin family protein, partial [Thioclava sp. UBA3469]